MQKDSKKWGWAEFSLWLAARLTAAEMASIGGGLIGAGMLYSLVSESWIDPLFAASVMYLFESVPFWMVSGSIKAKEIAEQKRKPKPDISDLGGAVKHLIVELGPFEIVDLSARIGLHFAALSHLNGMGLDLIKVMGLYLGARAGGDVLFYSWLLTFNGGKRIWENRKTE